MRGVLSLDDARLSGKRVLFRVDINSPLDPSMGEFLDDTRLRAILPTLRKLADAKVVILGHQSRPGREDFTSMEGHAQRIERILGRQIRFVPDVCGEIAMDAIKTMQQGEMLMLDNVRGHPQEIGLKRGTPEELVESEIVQNLSSVCDAYVIDAFAAAHRNSPSLSGFGTVLPSFAGRLMEGEVEALSMAVESPPQPYVAILGGAKCDDSLLVAENLLAAGKVEKIIAVGVVGNLMLWAAGYDIGEVNRVFIERSLDDSFAETKELADKIWSEHSDSLILPCDLAIEEDGERRPISVDKLPTKYPIYDIGIGTLMAMRPVIMDAGCVLWNGPASYFEKEAFAFGTIEVLNICAETSAYTIIGGGHTSALVNQRRVAGLFDHNSTGGGACLTMLSGALMPGIEALYTSSELFGHRLAEFGIAPLGAD